MISTAEAPSVIWLELPAVTLPSSLNAGFSLPSVSTVVSGADALVGRRPTVAVGARSPAMISFSKRPFGGRLRGALLALSGERVEVLAA